LAPSADLKGIEMASSSLLGSVAGWGLAMAILAGLMVYLLYKSNNKKKMVTSLKKDYAIFEQELLFVTKPMINYSFDNVQKAPVAMAQAYDAIRSKRIDLYHKYLKNERNEVYNLLNYQDSFLDYYTASKDLNSKLTDLINLHISKDSENDINGRYVYRYLIGQLLNLPDHEAVSLTDIPTKTLDRILKVQAKIIHNEPLMRICREYLDKKREVEANYELVRSQLQQIPR
jgi:hypothetical protein